MNYFEYDPLRRLVRPLVNEYKDLSDDEHKQVGRLVLTINVVLLFLCILVVVILSSCSTHKEMSHGLHIDTTTIHVDTSATSSVRVVTNDTTALSAHTSTISTTTSTFSDDVDEEVTEHIVETTDTAGNKTVTTDRTTKRKKKSETQTDATLSAIWDVELVDMSSSDVDSTSSYEGSLLVDHTEIQDSTSKSLVQESAGSGIVAFFAAVWVVVKWALGIIPLALLAWFTYCYIKCK